MDNPGASNAYFKQAAQDHHWTQEGSEGQPPARARAGRGWWAQSGPFARDHRLSHTPDRTAPAPTDRPRPRHSVGSWIFWLPVLMLMHARSCTKLIYNSCYLFACPFARRDSSVGPPLFDYDSARRPAARPHPQRKRIKIKAAEGRPWCGGVLMVVKQRKTAARSVNFRHGRVLRSRTRTLRASGRKS